jgi:hypothetical protein
MPAKKAAHKRTLSMSKDVSTGVQAKRTRQSPRVVKNSTKLAGSSTKTLSKPSFTKSEEYGIEEEGEEDDDDDDDDAESDYDADEAEDNDEDEEDESIPSEHSSEEEGTNRRKSTTKRGTTTSARPTRTKSNDLQRSGVKTGLGPGTVVVTKRPKAREAGGTPFTDDTIHPNTMLFLGDLASNNNREWLKSKSFFSLTGRYGQKCMSCQSATLRQFIF